MHPGMAFGFLLAVAFDPFSFTGATSLRWALLAVALPVLLWFSEPGEFNLPKLIGTLFVTWTALTFTWTANVLDGTGELIQLCIIATSFVWASRANSLAPIFMGLGAGIAVSSIILIIPPLHNLPSIVLLYPHGLFGNRNMLAEVAVLTLLGCLAYRRYWFIPGLLPAIFWQPQTRGALLALVVGLACWLWTRSRVLCGGLVVLSAVGLWLAIDLRPSSVTERFYAWEAVLNHLTIFGKGIGSLYTLSPYMTDVFETTIRRLDHAHNEFLEILFEQGIPGIVLYVSLIGCASWAAKPDTRIILAGFLVISCVAFPWRIPANAFIGAIVLGHAIRSWRPLRDDYAHWRALLRTRYEKWHTDYIGAGQPEAGSQIQPV